MASALAFLAFLLAAWLTHRFSDPRSRLYLLDHPNERSLHSTPTPRSGGVALGLGALTAAVLYAGFHPLSGEWWWIGGAAATVGGVSFLDDRWSLPVVVRLVVHIAAAAALVAAGLGLERLVLPGLAWALPASVGAVVSVLFVVWMVNLYNFMDGMDGFAGGMAVFGFGSYAILGWMAGAEGFGAINLFIAAAAAGFLIFNFPPARVFMGDAGSASLGFLAGALALWADREGYFPLWVAVLVFSPFVVDATVTLGRRLLCREKVWQAHKDHAYQRLVELGWGHRRTVLAEYVLMLACAVSALWAMGQDGAVQTSLLSAWAVGYAVLVWGVRRLERSGRRTGDQ